MIRRKGLNICLLGFLILSTGCAPISKTTLSQGSPEELPGCYAVFPAEPWESVHSLEATIRGGSFSALGVTKGEPSERRLQSLLLTPEGFILFDADRQESGIVVRQGSSSFRFTGLCQRTDGGCVSPLSSSTGQAHSMGEGNGWDDDLQLGRPLMILTQRLRDRWTAAGESCAGTNSGKVIKEIVLNGPFVNGLASRIELRAFKPAPYRLRMTLVQPSP